MGTGQIRGRRLGLTSAQVVNSVAAALSVAGIGIGLLAAAVVNEALHR